MSEVKNADPFSIERLDQHMNEIVNEVVPLIRVNGTTSPLDELDALLAIARVLPTDEVTKPQVCLTIEQQGRSGIVGTLGNISTIIGKAKAKKTFAVTMAVAAAVGSSLVLDRIRGLLDPGKNAVLLFDTEQSRYHVLNIVKRICTLSRIDQPPNLLVYALRPHAPDVRMKLIDRALQTTPNLGLVIIDGVRDLAVDPIMDAEQASRIMTALLRWTDELNIHILTVLHQNKGDTNARGFLGTELANKSETVISVTRDPTNKDISTIAPDYCRNAEFEPFSFAIDPDGLPYLVEDGLTAARSGQPGKRANDAITPETVLSIIERAFTNEPTLRYGQLFINVKEACEHAGFVMGKNKIESFIQRAVLAGTIQRQGSERSPTSAYALASSLPSPQPF